MGKIKYYIEKAYQTFHQQEMRVLPGNIAFFFVLALIPMLTVVAVVASYFHISVDMIVEFIQGFMPSEVSGMIVEVVSGKGFDASVGTFSLIALFSASNGTYAIINASNTMYQVEKSDVLKDRLKFIFFLFILLLLIIFLILVPMFGEKILLLFGNGMIAQQMRNIYHLLNWPLTIFLIYVNLKLIYTIAPSISIPSRTTTYGALFTTIIWTIATAVFSYYLNHFANYNVIYGNLSSIIILMMWLYIISYVFVMGMAINATNSVEK